MKANNSKVEPGVSPLTDTNGVTFAMGNELGASAEELTDYGELAGNIVPGVYQLTTPIGIYGVTSVDTMLQDWFASNVAPSLPGAPNATGQSNAVTFEFSSTSNGSGSDIFETVYLTNGQDIRSGVTCTSGCGGLGAYQTGYRSSDTLTGYISTSLASSLNSGAAASTANVNETFTPNVFSAPYSSIGLNNAYSGSTGGNVQLDDQSFSFGSTYANDYLVAVIVNNQMTTNVSKLSLEAITVQQPTPTPEPSTIVLLLTGLGSIGLGRLRRKK